jgi:hypothetical protein
MKLTRWGSGKFFKPQKAYIAVVVPAHIEGKLQYRWVTDICYQGHKEWVAENHKKAFLWSDKRHAEEFVTSLSWNGTAAWTVTVFPDCIPENNW